MRRDAAAAVQPVVFERESDINRIGGGCFRGTGSTYVRQSAMPNMRELVAGKEGLLDQRPDEGKRPW